MIGDCRLPIGHYPNDQIENRQLEMGNVIGRWRSRAVPFALRSNALPVSQWLAVAILLSSWRRFGAFRLRIAAEIRVIGNPTGSGSRRVKATLIKGLAYHSLKLLICSRCAASSSGLAPAARAFSIM